MLKCKEMHSNSYNDIVSEGCRTRKGYVFVAAMPRYSSSELSSMNRPFGSFAYPGGTSQSIHSRCQVLKHARRRFDETMWYLVHFGIEHLDVIDFFLWSDFLAFWCLIGVGLFGQSALDPVTGRDDPALGCGPTMKDFLPILS